MWNGIRIMSQDHVDAYVRLGRLGDGGFGHVAKAKHGETEVALKIINTHQSESAASAKREIDCLRKLDHPNIITMRDVFFVQSVYPFVYIVLDLMPTSLVDLMKRPLTPDEVQRFTRDLFSGLVACHTNDIVHCDIKPANLLVGDVLKIADFGLARAPQDVSTRDLATLYYRAPEFLLDCGYVEPSSDVWSAGVVVMEMCRATIAKGTTPMDQLLRIFWLLGSPTPAEWPDLPFMPNWSPLLPVFAPQPNVYAAADEFGVGQIARNSFVTVPARRWRAVAAAAAETNAQTPWPR